MWKLTASLLSVAAAGGPVAAAPAAEGERAAPSARSKPALMPEPPPVALEIRARSEIAERGAERRARARRRRERRRPSPALEAIAACESGGDPSAVGGGGAYRGKYQMSPSTWSSVGGEGDPAEASEAEQDRRATKLFTRSGPSAWPACR